MPLSTPFLITLLLTATNSAGVAAGPETVTFTAKDGQPLVATYWAPGIAAVGSVVMLPMENGNRSVFQAFGARLAARGFHALALDPRGHGESLRSADGANVNLASASTEAGKTPFWMMHEDVRAALDFLASRGAPKDRAALLAAGSLGAVALHAAVEHPDLVSAVAILSPTLRSHGLPLLEDAAAFGDRQALLIAGADESSLGGQEIADAMKNAKLDRRTLVDTAVHGTRMFGRVPTIEADLVDWFEKSLSKQSGISIPLTKDIIVDGRIDPSEGAVATKLSIPLESGASATVRVSRSKSKLLFGFDIPERCLRQNEVVVYIDASGRGPEAPDASCWRVEYQPSNPGTSPLRVSQGDQGAFKSKTDSTTTAYSNINEKARWTAEISVSLAALAIPESGATIRVAFTISGQKKGMERSLPSTANIKNAPRTWLDARFDS